MYDAILVGARVAGAPTALLLARQGQRVLLVDRATFPSDTLSTHYIHQPGVERLRRWGLLDRLIETGCPPSTRWTFDVGPLALHGFPSPSPSLSSAADYCPRRTILDGLLVEAAVESGAEVREGFTVQDLVWEGDQVVGIRGRAARGSTVTERARIVIGADGLHSFVARSVQAPTSEARPALTCAYYTYWSGVAAEGLELYPRPGNAIIVMPTHANLTCIAVQWPVQRFDEVRADIERAYLAVLETMAPALAERVRGGRREERFVGTADLPFFYRQAFGPGWALIGDAGYHLDPGTGQGMSNAFFDAELLAEALTNGRPTADGLAGYDRERTLHSRPMYDYTWKVANLAPPSVEEQALIGALSSNQTDTDRFFGVLSGTVPLPEFFDPSNLARIIGAAPVGGTC